MIDETFQVKGYVPSAFPSRGLGCCIYCFVLMVEPAGLPLRAAQVGVQIVGLLNALHCSVFSPSIWSCIKKQNPLSRVSYFFWCNQLGSNQRPPPSQGGALIQLSYGCKMPVEHSELFIICKKNHTKNFSLSIFVIWESSMILRHSKFPEHYFS